MIRRPRAATKELTALPVLFDPHPRRAAGLLLALQRRALRELSREQYEEAARTGGVAEAA